MLEWTGLTPRNFYAPADKRKQGEKQNPPDPPGSARGTTQKKTKGGEGPVHSLFSFIFGSYQNCAQKHLGHKRVPGGTSAAVPHDFGMARPQRRRPSPRAM